MDPIGAVVPKAEIQVYKRGSYPLQPAKTLKTDDGGRFSDNPDPGTYTVFIQMHGFRTEFLNVEISPSSKDDELRLPLQVATSDDYDCRTFGSD